MAQQLVNNLLRWKQVILSAGADAAESQSPNEDIKG